MWFFYDYYYIALVLPMVVFAMIAQFSVTSTFDRYSKKLTMRGITGEESARMILNANGLLYFLLSYPTDHVTSPTRFMIIPACLTA